MRRLVWIGLLCGALLALLGAWLLLSGQAIDKAPFVVLLAVAGPLLIVGQVVVIALNLPRPDGARSDRGRGRDRRSWNLFLALPPKQVLVSGALLVVGAWSLGLLAMSMLSSGVPHEDGQGCAYYQNDHGDVTCIDEEQFHRAQAAMQALPLAAAAFFAGFQALGLSAAHQARARSATSSRE